jgi:hypothetical protein
MSPTTTATVTDSTATASPAPTGDPVASGDLDCGTITGEQVAKFVIWSQLFAQVRTVDGLQTMATLGYTSTDMAALLDQLDHLKGVEGEVYGTPDDALVLFRTANDTFGAIIAKGDAATDADFAPLDDLAPDATAWINAQASISTALNAACPDITLN